jgi:hypothetical protein
VISVIIDQNRWLHLQQHASVGDRGAPQAVLVAMGSVIGDAEIQASWPYWNTTATTTTWTCWVVTQNALGCVRVEYQKYLYDDIEERTNKLTPSSQSAWVRPLSGVTELRWGAVYAEQAEFDTYYPAEPLTVTFTDWETKIGEADFPVDQRPKADQLLAAIRKSLNF